VLDTPAAPAPEPVAKAGTPEASVKPPSPTKPSASPAPTPTPSGGTSSPPSGPAAAGGSNLPPQPVPLPKPKEPEKPVAPPPLPKDAAPSSLEPKDMLLSKRFYGLAITAVGTTHLFPRDWSDWMNNEGNRELISWVAVVVVGVLLYQYGRWKAQRPLK
jgi:hypothetical protein